MGEALPQDLVAAVTADVDAHAAELVALLQTMVRYRSENPKLVAVEPGAEAECQAFIADRLADLGLTVDRWEVFPKRPDVVGVLRGAGHGRSLILNGHVDTVPAGDPATWPKGSTPIPS
jgi:acetylornithine deacetylase/succinyl-diaminopimelate desuccinylase-like protein